MSSPCTKTRGRRNSRDSCQPLLCGMAVATVSSDRFAEDPTAFGAAERHNLAHSLKPLHWLRSKVEFPGIDAERLSKWSTQEMPVPLSTGSGMERT